MYRAPPGSAVEQIRDTLKSLVRAGLVEIGLSYHVVFELLQKASPEHRPDRLERANLLSKLCERNVLPYPSDIGQGFRFSNDGLWVPRIDLEEVEIENVVQHLMHVVTVHPDSSRHERRVHAKRKYLNAWAQSNPTGASRLHAQLWPFLFARDFAIDRDLARYLSGDMTREIANERLRFHITDPASVYTTYFDLYGRDNPIAERRDAMAHKFCTMLEELRGMLSNGDDLRRRIDEALALEGEQALSPAGRTELSKIKTELRTFRAETLSPEELSRQVPTWKDMLGEEGALIAAQILFAFHREGRPIKRSDAIDFIHACYLPHVDLWRGDKAFSDLLIKHQVKFSERVVSSLEELPSRMEAEAERLAHAA
ncbi:hypothetical protein [Bradyrhizobium arachidis]|uniref:hypothetical protein n=1 Tax=Bradyrhizobium arachidis TaxID=858423 RepID=UPI0021630CE2|nr:hypothetical protein [Bradyrhizobium arachidis]UVO30174.1 hypothetical protein KUF59_05245 [Bradyrhizobium arachidis]